MGLNLKDLNDEEFREEDPQNNSPKEIPRPSDKQDPPQETPPKETRKLPENSEQIPELHDNLKEFAFMGTPEAIFHNYAVGISINDGLPLVAGDEIDPLCIATHYKWDVIYVPLDRAKIPPDIYMKCHGHIQCRIEHEFASQIFASDIDARITKVESIKSTKKDGTVISAYRPVTVAASITDKAALRFEKDPRYRYVFEETKAEVRDLKKATDPIMEEMLKNSRITIEELTQAANARLHRMANIQETKKDLAKNIMVNVREYPEILAEGSEFPEHETFISIPKEDFEKILKARESEQPLQQQQQKKEGEEETETDCTPMQL